jgi:8-oxo-dGTP pyrophosphatase MutT (NUDIX family)
MQITQIPFGTNPNDKKEAVFVLIHSTVMPYIHYNSPKHDRNTKAKAFLVSNRRDNTKGFLGGTANKNETLEETLKREIKEEFLIDIDTSKLTPLCSHEAKVVGHLYEYEVSEVEFFKNLFSINDNFNNFYKKHIEFLNQSVNCDDILQYSRDFFGVSHFFAEIRSVEAMYITQNKRDFNNLLQNLFADSCKYELEIFFNKYNIK